MTSETIHRETLFVVQWLHNSFVKPSQRAFCSSSGYHGNNTCFIINRNLQLIKMPPIPLFLVSTDLVEALNYLKWATPYLPALSRASYRCDRNHSSQNRNFYKFVRVLFAFFPLSLEPENVAKEGYRGLSM